ncbi:MAG: DUF86 domain-containing protein [Anaerolineales bacterium]|nr:DUF86 domain-containing protein [Anaerolineales bacterium]
MRPEEHNLAYLWDMREAAREIAAFVKGIKYAGFIQNRMIRYAVERQLMVIGEAANHVSEAFQKKHPEIPWRQIIGQRNVLAHEYGDIKVDRIWSVFQRCSKHWSRLSRKIEASVADIRKAERELGWRPKIGVDEGVGRLFEWVNANKHLF